jgi:hypothetical protein
MQDAHCTDSSGKSDCLWRVKCNITGASCPKMDAILQKLDDTETDNTMSNTAKNTPAATPKDVKDAVEEKTVPAQATAPEDAKTGEQDKVLNNEGKVLYSGTPDEVKAWLDKQPSMIYVVRQATNNGLVVSSTYIEEGPLKLSLVQRAKAAAEKLKKNKKAMLIVAGAAVVVGLTVKNNRKVVTGTVENPYHDESEQPAVEDDQATDENPDSV